VIGKYPVKYQQDQGRRLTNFVENSASDEEISWTAIVSGSDASVVFHLVDWAYERHWSERVGDVFDRTTLSMDPKATVGSDVGALAFGNVRQKDEPVRNRQKIPFYMRRLSTRGTLCDLFRKWRFDDRPLEIRKIATRHSNLQWLEDWI